MMAIEQVVKWFADGVESDQGRNMEVADELDKEVVITTYSVNKTELALPRS